MTEHLIWLEQFWQNLLEFPNKKIAESKTKNHK